MSSAVRPRAGPSETYPFEATCSKCSYKQRLHSPDRAIKTDSGELQIISNYRADLKKHGLTWQGALAAGRIVNIFRFVCARCGRIKEVTRPYERTEAGCFVAGALTLVFLVAVVLTLYHTVGGEVAFVIVPTAPLLLAVFSEIVEWPYARKMKQMRDELHCEECNAKTFVPLSEARLLYFNCPQCGEKTMRYLAVEQM